jgi:hypothetical protein
MSDLQPFFGGAFDSTSVPPAEDFPVLPPGDYPVLIESAEVKATKSKDGAYVKVKMSVVDGQFKGRELFDNINIHNPNQQCVEIGLRSLAALGQSVGLRHVADTDQLANKVCVAHVKVKDNQNVIRTYSSATPTAAPAAPQPTYQPPASPVPGTYPQQSGGFAPSQYQPPAQPTQPQQSAPPAGNKPPWMR